MQTPTYARSGKLLALQDLMKEFEVSQLAQSLRIALDTADIARKLGSKSSAARQHLLEQLIGLANHCEEAGLPMSRKAVNRIRTLFDMSPESFSSSIEGAVRRAIITIEDELELRSYLALEPSEATLYSNPWAGWENIVTRFGDTSRDIEEMNKCFALNRYTAAMFHALHVAEIGSIELGAYIGVTDPKPGWGPTVRKLDDLVKAGHSKIPSNLSGKFEFIEQIHRETQTMMFAWRHKVDHAANHLAIIPNTDFTPDIARHIIDSVKVFMTRLEDGLK